MVDLTTDSSGKAQARLLDLDWGDLAPPTPGGSTLRTRRSGPESKHAALDPSRGYANALRDSLSDAVQVLDAVHVVKLGTAVVNEVRRRVQQEQLGHRGHQDDPLYKIRGLLRHGAEHLTERQRAKLVSCLDAGDPNDEVAMAWSCYQQLRQIYSGPQPDQGAARAGREGHRVLPVLPDPGGRAARPDLARMEVASPGLLRHRRRQQRRH